MSANLLKQLYEYFPTAVDTGQCLVFISDQTKVELWELKNASFGIGKSNSTGVRVKTFRRALNGDFIPSAYQDFQLSSISELAQQIERYIQFSVGQNIKEKI